jgi:hypothetical protein
VANTNAFFNLPAVRDISRSWLMFISDALADEQIPLLIQANAIHTESDLHFEPGDSPPNGLNAYVITGPSVEWQASSSGMPNTIDCLFRLHVMTKQRSGDLLAAYDRNLTIQIALNHILFGPERFLSGFSTGLDSNGDAFSIPFWTFGENGTPLQLVDAFGLRYTATGISWVAVSSVESNRCIWRLDLALSVTA